MSTRALVRVYGAKPPRKPLLTFYKHQDGYPSWLGQRIKTATWKDRNHASEAHLRDVGVQLLTKLKVEQVEFRKKAEKSNIAWAKKNNKPAPKRDVWDLDFYLEPEMAKTPVRTLARQSDVSYVYDLYPAETLSAMRKDGTNFTPLLIKVSGTKPVKTLYEGRIVNFKPQETK